MQKQNKAQKKLKAFHKEKEKTASRFKALVSFIEIATDEEQRQFFSENYEQIFSVFLARYAECDVMPKKEKKPHMQNVEALLKVLRTFLIYLPNLIKKRWQFAKIARVIEQGLDYKNRHEVRMASFELLLLFLEALQTSMDEQIGWFARAINLDPFTKPATARQTPPTGPTSASKEAKGKKDKTKKSSKGAAAVVIPDQTLLCPARVEATREDGIEMLDFFFDFITSPQRKEKFEFWLDLWKQNYYSVFYPQVSLDVGLVSGITDHRFVTQCPLEVQHCIVGRITHWADDSFLTSILWLPKNGPLLMEISRQACCMPIPWNYTIRLGIQLMQSFITGGKAKLSAADTQHYWKQFMGNLALVFFIKTSQREEELAAQAELCKEVLHIFTTYSGDYASKMDKDTWIALQRILLETTYTLLSNNSPVATSIAALMSDNLFQCLYLIWIRSTVTTPELWAEFSKKVSTLTAWKATVNEWKVKVLQLTYILISYAFEHRLDKHHSGQEKESEEKGDNLVPPQSPRKAAFNAIAPAKNPIDPRLTAISWNSQSIYAMWHTLLNILGNLNDIQDSNNFSLAITCISEIIELLQFEESFLSIHSEPPISIYTHFLPWILQACTVEEKRSRGRLAALATLCKIFVRQHVRPLHVDLLSHFYRTVQQVLHSNNQQMVFVLIRHTAYIFSYDLAGVSVLIPAYLKEIEQLWKGGQKPPPEDVQTNSLHITLALICHPTHFAGLSLPEMSTAQMETQIGVVLQTALKNRDISSADKILCLWGITQRVLVFLLSDVSPNKKEEVGEMVRSLISCTSREEAVSRAALDGISTISQPPFLNLLAALDVNILYYIIDNLSDNIIGLTTSASNAQEGVSVPEAIVAGHFYALLDIFLTVGLSDQIDFAPSIISKVFRALACGLLGDEAAEKTVSAAPASRGLGPRADPKKRAPERGKPGSEASLISAAESLLESAKSSPSHRSDIIREAAEVFLLTLLNHFKNFPTIVGSEQLTCHPAEPPADKKKSIEPAEATGENTMFFIYDSLYVVALEELDEGSKKVRLTLRDCTGKYVWEFDIAYDGEGKLASSDARTSLPQNLIAAGSRNTGKPSVPQRRNAKELPSFAVCSELEIDPLRHMLDYLAVTHEDILPPPSTGPQRMSFAQPQLANPLYDLDLEELKQALKQQATSEEKAVAQLQAAGDKRPSLPFFPEFPGEPTKFQYCRLLLSHLGFINDENRKKFLFLQSNKRLFRSIRELDKINGREVVKVGLIFVAEGQEDQYAILRNEGRNRYYDDFVKGLGWNIDVAAHRGFIGGLDKTNGTSGWVAPYWASPTTELIFHDITIMPTKSSEPQQIHKKRHVGNDAVHVIWTEHKKLYDPATITSQFNDVHIVIYPLPSGLFRVQIYQKENVPPFGPIVDGMVLDHQLLAPLVRATAINANRAVRSFKKEFKKPFPTRSAMIKEIYQRYREDKEFEDYMGDVFFPPIFSEEPPPGEVGQSSAPGTPATTTPTAAATAPSTTATSASATGSATPTQTSSPSIAHKGPAPVAPPFRRNP